MTEQRIQFPSGTLTLEGVWHLSGEEGRSPKTPGLLSHEWWNTPNRRFFSILDFEEFCRDRGVKIRQRVFLDTETGAQISADPNRNADLAIFALGH